MQLSLDDPDTLLVWLYNLIDSFFAQTELPFYTERFSNNKRPYFTDAELFTTAIFPILMGYTEKKLGHRYLRRHYRDWFPALPVYEVWNRRLNREPEALHYVYNLILRYLAPPYRIQEFVIDTLPVVVCQAQHSAHSRAAKPFVTLGYCKAKKKYYTGAKIELLAGFRGDGLPIPGGYIIATAQDHDLTIAKDTMPDITGIKIFGDKAFIDRKLQLDLFNQYIELVVPIKKKKNGPPLGLFDQAYNSLHSAKRQPIESLVAWINNKTRIEEASKVRSVNGLLSTIAVKMIAALLMFLLNF
jgi:hypothetical protein